MQRPCVWTVRVSVLLLLLVWSNRLACQSTADHRKVPQRPEPQQEFRAEVEEVQGSWGTWGPWSSCSRTCGIGVQEQKRPCLPMYAPSHYSPRRSGGHLQQPGLVISALRPTVPLHRDPARFSNSSSRGELRREKESRPGGRRRIHHITPGRYGYGKRPYAPPLQTNAGQVSGTASNHRQRRSAADESRQPVGRGHRANGRDPPDALHRYGGPYVPKNNPVWAPLYQPGLTHQAQVQQELQNSRRPQHQQRPYSPLPASSCAGEHAHYRMCNSNECPPFSRNIRAVQCSSYNNQPFMGRLYEWEPFNEVLEDQHCELNCRAVGFRFYVQQSDRVIDGTPCGQNDTFVCVAGKCTLKKMRKEKKTKKKTTTTGGGAHAYFQIP